MMCANFKFLLALSLFALISYAACETPCPAGCNCHRDVIRCNHQYLTKLPQTPSSTQLLDFRFNYITDIPPRIFENHHRLRMLMMNDNQVKEIHSKSFKGLLRIKIMYLYRNQITHIDPDSFRNLLHLTQLYLQDNFIHTIESETFSNLPNLNRLFLQDNKLKSIPPGSFSGLTALGRLRLDGNPFICDCSLKWFYRMILDNRKWFVSANCFEPEKLLGKKIAKMADSDFYCHRPQILREPQDVTVDSGKIGILTCAVSGEPQPKIEWRLNSSTIAPDSGRYEILENGTLFVHGIDENDNAIFECTARNPAGLVRSKRAKMTVRARMENFRMPIFTVPPLDQMTRLGESMKMTCVARGHPPASVQWYHNNEKLRSTNRIKIKKSTLKVINVQETDAGIYTCEAQNHYKKISIEASFYVMVKPTIIVAPEDKNVTIGETATFTCVARGFPKPVITWESDSLFTNDDILITDERQNFTILNVQFSNNGSYHCIAENSEGNDKATAKLFVNQPATGPPKVISLSGTTDVYKGFTVQFICEVDSRPTAVINWRKNGAHVIIDGRITTSTQGLLSIDNVTLTDAGTYECSAHNFYGTDLKTLLLKVSERVDPGDEYIKIAYIEATRDIDQAIANTIEQLTESKSNLHDLYRKTQFPNAPERKVARGAEIYERMLEKVKGMIQSKLEDPKNKTFQFENEITPKQLNDVAQFSGCVAKTDIKDCTDVCYHLKFRAVDGSCNNFAKANWGTSLSGFRRILPAIYENGFSHPVGWNKNKKYHGFSLPSARLVSNTVISTNDISEDVMITHMVMQWGQWLDHDLDHALPSVSSQTWDGVDCKKTCEYAAPCFPIDVPDNDPRISNRRCIDFIRTSSICTTDKPSIIFGELKPREQINQLTSFIDASQVYGFDKTVAEDLRDLTVDKGLLRVGATFPEKKPLLPTTGINGMDCRRNITESDRTCFVAGDIRANEQIGLLAMHTIWMREHNRLASDLKVINPFWDGERVYQEARKIVGAEIQFITYEHWLPLILGPEGYHQIGEYKGYDSNLNPSVSNVFATAALRFGHSIINPVLHRYDVNFEVIPQGHLLLRNAFFSPWRLVDEGGVDPLIRGMFTTPAKLKTPQQNLNSELTEELFFSAHAVALDLAAINIQRGRDHALPSYTKWRDFCNMTKVFNFDDLQEEISDKSVREKLQVLYGSVHNIDVWVGGILEDQVEGGKVGPLFRCLLIEQFKRLRDGDRLWYENPTTFKPRQIEQIKKTSLARVLCDNGDEIDTVGQNVFLLPEIQGGMLSCDDIPSIDLSFWADCDSCDLHQADNEIFRYPRDLTSHNDYDSQLADYQRRLSKLESAQSIMMETVALLKDRVDYLEGYNDTNYTI